MPRSMTRAALFGATLLLTTALPLTAQQAITTDMASDLAQLKQKYLGLAEAMPDASYTWRPGQGVRSVAELYKHVISDNYMLPAMAGATPPVASGIKGDDYQTTVAYEAREMTKAQIVAELKASFEFAETALKGTAEASLGEPVNMFGRNGTKQGLWYLTMGHLHEHLGQAIAYARSNDVVPPWSRRQ